jgi:cell division protein FtsN
MARDYKHVARNGSRGRRRSTKESASRRTPRWVWLLTGLCVGLLITLGVYLYNRNHEAQLAKQTAALEQSAADAKGEQKPANTGKGAAEKPKEEEQRFDFYTLLPKQEVVIPESEIREEQQRLQAKETVIYTLQAGSFRSHEEADTLKARLAMLGVESHIVTASNEDGTKHKVRIGPLSNSREMNRIRNRLHSNRISTLVLREQKTK